MSQIIFGAYAREGRLFDATPCSGTTAVVSDPKDSEKLDVLSLQLLTTGTVAGHWKIEVSNDFSVGFANDRAFDGSWSDVTALFTPTIAAVTTGGSNQFTQAWPFAGRSYRVTFTPTTGTGTVSCYVFGKGF